MAFSGTLQKCKSCDKTVHFAEMMSADGVPFHRTCFRCSVCNGRLAMSSYSVLEGTLYCKTHFEQHLKEIGGVTAKKVGGPPKPSDMKSPSKVSNFFSGTQDKCATCKKTVYPLEKVTVEGDFYHKSCFRCAHGGCNLSPSNYAALDGILYCKPHFSQLFKEKGSYNHLTKTASLKKKTAAEATEATEATQTEEAVVQDPPAETESEIVQ